MKNIIRWIRRMTFREVAENITITLLIILMVWLIFFALPKVVKKYLSEQPENKITSVEIYDVSCAVPYGEEPSGRFIYVVRWITADGTPHVLDFADEHKQRAFTLYDYLMHRAVLVLTDEK